MRMRAVVVLALALVLGLVVVGPSESATCNPLDLIPCSAAVLSGAQPSPSCCAKLKEQRPCFCQYSKNPNLKQYVNSGNGKKTLATCGVAVPSC
ncbi:non-specific lipid-transfer protein 2-like [Zingiber officinale]|uniref:Bifunctional inhibitor/plant lipid transfer protein/seed storage helical domain-containing protein n=1 Tax=Zingiber officinale TaxID=94328 RepID=A0A8J5C5I9_ZINOF|nr:non-specific lipid-transfer protein 2-like [Zingiber officinale]KAG6471663.1 hypothetical protein ZIOFF_069109 [Zingiber officinale]